MTTVQTQKPGLRNGCYWRYIDGQPPQFSGHHFSDNWLQSHDCVVGSATGGRATASFLNIDGHDMVLRRFRRGGWAQHLTESHYIWTGLENTRAFAEFNCLDTLIRQNLPVPPPYACEVIRYSLTYQASLITHRLPGTTWASTIAQGERLSHSLLQSIGRCIARFHAAGVFHADLNAHNILVSETSEEPVSLIDFDKAQVGLVQNGEWQQKNLNRLHRSLVKEYGKMNSQLPIDAWTHVLAGYKNA